MVLLRRPFELSQHVSIRYTERLAEAEKLYYAQLQEIRLAASLKLNGLRQTGNGSQIDRRLYLPEAWAEDDARRSRVQIPASVRFATKPQIACAMIAAALDAGVPCKAVASRMSWQCVPITTCVF